MRCKICNSILEKPTWNSQLNDWEVCGECLEIIFSVFEDTPDERPGDDESEEEVEHAHEDAVRSIRYYEALEPPQTEENLE